MMNKKLTGIILSYFLIVLDTVVGIVLIPLILHTVGDYEYGIYKLLLSTASYLSVLDFGLGSTITRYIVKYNTEGREKEKENFMAMGLVIYGVLSIVVLIFALVVGFFIPTIYSSSISQSDMKFAQIMFVVMCSTTAVRLFDHAYNGLFTAYERFTYSKGMNVFKTAMRFLLIFIGLYFIKNVMVVAVVDFFLAITILVMNMLYTKFNMKFMIKLHKWNWNVAKEAGIFTLAILAQSVINQFNSNVDNVVLGIFETATSITVYSMALQLYTMYSNLSTAVSSIFLPSISRKVFSRATDDEITESIIRPSRMQLMVLLLALSGFILFGKDFIGVWVGIGYDTAYILAIILLTTSTIELSQNTITSVLKAKNKLHGNSAILGVSTLVNVIITLILVPRLGVYGAVIGTAFSLVFGYGFALNIYYHKKIGINMFTYYRKTYKGVLPAAILAFIPGALISHFVKANSWGMFILESVIFCVIYAVIVYFVGMDGEEKNYVKTILRKFRRKISLSE